MTATSPGTGSQLRRFLFEQSPVRGAVVRIEDGWRELLSHREYPQEVRHLLGEAMAAAPLLASGIKFEGRLSLQAEGDGPIRLMLVQVTHDLEVRGVARHAGNTQDLDLPGMFGSGRFGLIVEPQGRESYQAIVPLAGQRLQHCLAAYFDRSEQLPTWFCLAADEQVLAGLMLQRVPGSASQEQADEDWSRLLALATTLTETELLALQPSEVLYRLFHEDAVRVFEPQAVHLRCRCSHGRISEMLLGLGRQEVESVVAEQGQVEIECGFCGRRYVYTPAEVSELFGAQTATPPTPSHH
jgi:molecular chaperone Hsp33